MSMDVESEHGRAETLRQPERVLQRRVRVLGAVEGDQDALDHRGWTPLSRPASTPRCDGAQGPTAATDGAAWAPLANPRAFDKTTA